MSPIWPTAPATKSSAENRLRGRPAAGAKQQPVRASGFQPQERLNHWQPGHRLLRFLQAPPRTPFPGRCWLAHGTPWTGGNAVTCRQRRSCARPAAHAPPRRRHPSDKAQLRPRRSCTGAPLLQPPETEALAPTARPRQKRSQLRPSCCGFSLGYTSQAAQHHHKTPLFLIWAVVAGTTASRCKGLRHMPHARHSPRTSVFCTAKNLEAMFGIYANKCRQIAKKPGNNPQQ